MAAAYETLSDNDKRRLYDQGGEDALKQGGGQQGGMDPFDLFSHFGGFGNFFGQQQGGHRGQEERRGPDLELELQVTLADLYSGRVMEVAVRNQQLCPKCRGHGAQHENDVVTCTSCQGRGVKIQMHQIGPGFVQQVQMQCDVCGGKGKIIKSTCRRCKGKKVVTGEKKLDIHVEAGMPDGHKIVSGHTIDCHSSHVGFSWSGSSRLWAATSSLFVPLVSLTHFPISRSVLRFTVLFTGIRACQ